MEIAIKRGQSKTLFEGSPNVINLRNARRNLSLICILFLLFSCGFLSYGGGNKEYYVFSTFREPADKGLFLAYSEDGYNWIDLGGPYLVPEVGIQKVMRDPSIVKGADNTFHLVWTSSWKGDKGLDTPTPKT